MAEQDTQEFSWRHFLRSDDLSNQAWNPQEIGYQLTAVVFDLDNTLIDSKAKLLLSIISAKTDS